MVTVRNPSPARGGARTALYIDIDDLNAGRKDQVYELPEGTSFVGGGGRSRTGRQRLQEASGQSIESATAQQAEQARLESARQATLQAQQARQERIASQRLGGQITKASNAKGYGGYVDEPGYQSGFVTSTGAFYPTRNEGFTPQGFVRGETSGFESGQVTITAPPGFGGSGGRINPLLMSGSLLGIPEVDTFGTQETAITPRDVRQFGGNIPNFITSVIARRDVTFREGLAIRGAIEESRIRGTSRALIGAGEFGLNLALQGTVQTSKSGRFNERTTLSLPRPSLGLVPTEAVRTELGTSALLLAGTGYGAVGTFRAGFVAGGIRGGTANILRGFSLVSIRPGTYAPELGVEDFGVASVRRVNIEGTNRFIERSSRESLVPDLARIESAGVGIRGEKVTIGAGVTLTQQRVATVDVFGRPSFSTVTRGEPFTAGFRSLAEPLSLGSVVTPRGTTTLYGGSLKVGRIGDVDVGLGSQVIPTIKVRDVSFAQSDVISLRPEARLAFRAVEPTLDVVPGTEFISLERSAAQFSGGRTKPTLNIGKGTITQLTKSSFTPITQTKAVTFARLQPSSSARSVLGLSSGSTQSLTRQSSIYAGTGLYERTEGGLVPQSMFRGRVSITPLDYQQRYSVRSAVIPTQSLGLANVYRSPSLPRQRTPQLTIPRARQDTFQFTGITPIQTSISITRTRPPRSPFVGIPFTPIRPPPSRTPRYDTSLFLNTFRGSNLFKASSFRPRYTPSLTATTFNIRGVIPKRFRGGTIDLGRRVIGISPRRKRKKRRK